MRGTGEGAGDAAAGAGIDAGGGATVAAVPAAACANAANGNAKASNNNSAQATTPQPSFAPRSGEKVPAARMRGAPGLLPMHAHVQCMQPARIGARHAEAEASQRQFLAGLGQVPDRGRDQPADG